MIGYSIAEAPIAGEPPSGGAAQLTAVRADFPAAYAILVAAPVAVAVRADFPAAYAILVAAPVAVAVRANFPAAYAILSGTIMAFERSKLRTLDVLPGGAVPFAAPTPGHWNMSNPKKPTGPKDPNAVTDFSLDWNKWLADCTDSIASHSFVLSDGLVNKGSSIAGGIVTIFVGGGEGATASITCHVVTASTPPREEDRTFFLSLEER